MDFDLPDIDGITLARQLAQQYPSLVLIGFSAHVIDETLRQRMIADGREHIKRFTDETLCADLMRVYEKTMSQPSATR